MKSTAVKCSAGKAWFNAVQVLTLLPLFVDRDDVQGWPCKLIEKEERLQLPLCFKGSEKLCTLWSVGELMNLGHLDLPKSIWLEGRGEIGIRTSRVVRLGGAIDREEGTLDR